MIAMAIPVWLALAGCAAPVAGTGAVQRADAGPSGLACALPTNCVSSLDGGRFAPMPFDRDKVEALTALRATLGQFPEASIVDAGPAMLVAIFRTPAGFEDEVIFRIDAARNRIDFRSRSLAGLFDFGKNASRMQEFVARFQRLPAR